VAESVAVVVRLHLASDERVLLVVLSQSHLEFFHRIIGLSVLAHVLHELLHVLVFGKPGG